MMWNKAGAYLGRQVRLACVESMPDQDELDSMEGDLLLVVLRNEVVDKGNLRGFLATAVRCMPLGIGLFGESAEEAFCILLEILSDCPPRLHVMTKLCHGEDTVSGLEDFLGAMWPCEERFNAWTGYSILIVADPEYCKKCLSAIDTLVDRATGVPPDQRGNGAGKAEK